MSIRLTAEEVGKLSKDLEIYDLLSRRPFIKFYKESWYDDEYDYNHCIVSFDLADRLARGRKLFVKTLEIHYYVDRHELKSDKNIYEIDYDFSRHETDYNWN